jgi:hypothetical protein
MSNSNLGEPKKPTNSGGKGKPGSINTSDQWTGDGASTTGGGKHAADSIPAAKPTPTKGRNTWPNLPENG